MWLLEFLFGIFLAYLVLSPKLRHLIFRRNHTTVSKDTVAAEEKRERQSATVNINGHDATVYKDELEGWLKKAKLAPKS